MASTAAQGKPGILLLVNGGDDTWHGKVLEIVRALDRDQPTEVAFGMPTRASLQAAVRSLEARGAAEIVAVPLFISPDSAIVRATEHLLGLRMDVSQEGTAPIVTTRPVRFEGLADRLPAPDGAPDARLVEWVKQAAARPQAAPAITESVVVQGRIGAALPLEPTLPGSFDVLSKRDLQLAPTVNEALRRVPGLSVRDEEGLGLRPNIGIRGLNPTRSTKLLLLEDGVPVTYAPYGDNASYYHPPLARFEAVEVLKGSGQIAYGPSTIGGVINYITPLPPSSPSGAVSLAAGNRGFLDGHASFGSTAGRVGYFVNLQGRASDGSRDAIHSTVGDTSGKLTFAASPRQFFVARGSHYRERSRNTYSGLRQAEFEANPRQNPFVNDRFSADRAGASLTHHLSVSTGFTVVSTAYASRFARDWWRQSSNSAQRPNDAADPGCAGMANLSTTCGNEGRLRRYIVGGVETRASVDFGRRGELGFGARLHAESQNRLQKNGETPAARDGRLVEHNERDVAAASAFLQHRFAAGPVAVTPGLRVEHVHFERRNALTGASGRTSLTQLIPGIGAAVSIGSRGLVFGGLHRGFAPPRVEDAITNSGGSVDLDSELSWNSEIGVRADLGRSVRADLTVFRMDYENQIVPASLAGGVGATLTNGGATLHQGLELGVRGETGSPGRAADRLYARLAYTFLPVAEYTGVRFSGVSGFSTVSVSGNRLPYAPEHLATVTGGYRVSDRADLFAEMVFVSSQSGDDLNTVAGTADGQRGAISGATTWNAGATVTFLPGRFSGFVAIYNAADRLFIVDRSRGIVPSPPRRAQAGVRVTF